MVGQLPSTWPVLFSLEKLLNLSNLTIVIAQRILPTIPCLLASETIEGVASCKIRSLPPPRFEKDKSITMALEVLVPSWVVEVKMGIRLLSPKATSYFSWSLCFFQKKNI
ncbi:hypothetical protein NC653_009391 [Populus alba x Populus x berolinensis]|uniref:Uncharacterized protein n=1 Tax=Populus alba x Populus x berolinensis TaxID=444605 RepID=A0AAD6R939_9ROSI|nr:hypothetical protein NC653_009391 [Populus alba x Populus x berolinensis]